LLYPIIKGITSLSGGKLSFNLKELATVSTVLGTTDIIKILQLTPGVQNSGDANGYLYVRGGDQDIMQYCMKERYLWNGICLCFSFL
jgi:hypothetical protein